MAESGITIDRGGRPSQEDIDEENQARAHGTAWTDFDAGQRPEEWQRDVNRARLRETPTEAHRSMGDFLRAQTMAKLGGPEESITAPDPEDALSAFPRAKEGPTDRSEGSSLPNAQELWNALGGFIKAPEREMNPATLAAWGTWNLANMGVEGGKKMWEAFKGLDEMIYGEGYQPGVGDEAGARAGIKAATAVAGAGVAIRKPPGSLSSFSGREGASNWAKAGRTQAETALDMAEMLDKKGYKEDQIRDLTRALAEEGNFGGVSKGADGKWRFEISDHAFEVVDYREIKKTGGFLDELIKHDDLFSAHPEMKDIPVIIQKMNPNMKNFRPSGGFDGQKITLEVQNGEQIRDVVAHEWQHWLQMKNDFARGADPALVGNEGYVRSAGENEARSVPLRQDLTPGERTEQHPSMHELDDAGKRVPRSTQIVRMTDELIAANEKSTGRFAIFSQVKEIDKKIASTQKRIDRLQNEIKLQRQPPNQLERKRNTLMTEHDKMKTLQDRRTALGVEPIESPKPNLIQAVIEETKQGAPKTGTEDIGAMAKKRSKMERLEERVESLTTVIENETRIPRKERAQKELTKVLNELKFIGEGK